MEEKWITESRRVPVRESYDVIVAGGGVAGIAAALSAARHGLQVLLMEKSVVLGGLANLGLINWYEPLCDGDGHLLTTGIAEELLKLSIRYGYDNLPTKWGGEDKERSHDVGRYATSFNPGMFSLALNELLTEEKIQLKYDMLASHPVMDGNTCLGVIAESKSGRAFYEARVVIDATGDADILARAQVPCRNGQNYLTYIGHGCSRVSMQKALEREDMVWLNASGFSAGSDLDGNGHPEGLPLFEGIDGDLVSRYVQRGQQLLFDRLRQAPRDKEQCLYTLPGMPQLRKTRCLIGAESFGGDDGKHAENSIGAVGDFRHPYRRYEIPGSVLYHPAYPNLLAAGRTVSAQDDGWEITRVIPTAALTGQASGVYAWQMLRTSRNAAEAEVAAIQRTLEQDGVRLHFD